MVDWDSKRELMPACASASFAAVGASIVIQLDCSRGSEKSLMVVREVIYNHFGDVGHVVVNPAGTGNRDLSFFP